MMKKGESFLMITLSNEVAILDKVNSLVEKFERERVLQTTPLLQILEQVNSISVAIEYSSDEQKEMLRVLTETGVIVTRMIKKLEDERKKKVEPLNEELQQINGHFRKLRTPLEQLKEALSKKLEQFAVEQQRRARLVEEQKRTLEEKYRTEEVARKGEAAPAVPLLDLEEDDEPKPIKKVEADTGSANIAMVWDWEVVNIKEVPAHLLLLNEREVKRMIDGGAREIAGLRIFQRPQARFRRS